MTGSPMLSRWTVSFFAALIILLQTQSFAAAAPTYTVTRFDDPNPDSCQPADCSLREAILQANDLINGGATINIPSGTYFLSRSDPADNDAQAGDLDIRRSMMLIGDGASDTIIDGSALSDRLFDLQSGASNVSIEGLTLRGGRTDEGGAAIRHAGGSLTLESLWITNNQAHSWGGAIQVNGATQLNVRNSTLSSNRSLTSDGGAIGIAGSGSLTLLNSTLSGNQADVNGGALYISASGSHRIESSTIISNSAGSDGDAIYHFAGTTSLQASIVLGNGNPEDNCSGSATLNSLGANLLRSGSCSADVSDTLTAMSLDQIVVTDLKRDVGETPSQQLLSGSPALDAISDCGSLASTDQRGGKRPFANGLCDIGAVEFGQPESSPTSVTLSAGASSIELSWSYSGTDWATVGYVIQRRVVNGDWQELTRLPSGSVGYIDSSVTCATDYEYQVAASNSNGLSAFTEGPGPIEADCPTPPQDSLAAPTTEIVNDVDVQIRWTDNVSGETAYRVDRYEDQWSTIAD
ncbi:MAG: hypothetical protein GYB68_18180, partial [Chloroflexi bacterium]|nr:hypothetical protein [Chloroflexota bacterium]